jgi:hypothetical protein
MGSRVFETCQFVVAQEINWRSQTGGSALQCVRVLTRQLLPIHDYVMGELGRREKVDVSFSVRS